ncbi:MAG: B12-binding domain-containing radical SAM protein [Acidimicrobiia bacterium]|nr:B12-binding domain-containing radical SAM protein [Acidimicrobiia bacterium]
MVDLVLSHGYFLSEDAVEQEIMKPYPPLGLLYLKAYLSRAGFDVEVFDTTFAQRDELVARLAAEPGGVLGLYTNLMTRASVVSVMQAARAHGWTVVAGGPESASYPEQYLAHGAHVVVVGEGEQTMEELLVALRDRNPHRLHDVAGVVFHDEDGRLVRTEGRAQIRDIDSLPWPDRDAIDIGRYVDVWRTHHGMGSINLITARGCPYKCNWCSHAVYGHSHRRRDPADCADEVRHIVDAYGPDQVWYADDVFTISHKWLFDYAEELRQRGLRIPFETISRADRMKKPEVFSTLADMGCYRIWIGSESGSQRILDAMQRGVSVEEVVAATHQARAHGIEVGMFLMWGYEGETIEDIEATIEHVCRADPEIFFTTVSYPIKGTGYYEKVADKLVATNEWIDATDRDLQIRGRHSRNYYRHADEWLRSSVDAHRLAASDPQTASARRQDAQLARAALVASAHEVEA